MPPSADATRRKRIQNTIIERLAAATLLTHHEAHRTIAIQRERSFSGFPFLQRQ